MESLHLEKFDSDAIIKDDEWEELEKQQILWNVGQLTQWAENGKRHQKLEQAL